jgi:Domain of unknown function (DUF4105)
MNSLKEEQYSDKTVAPASSGVSPSTPRALPGRIIRMIAVALGGLVLSGMTVWMGLAICYTNLHGNSPRTIRAALVVIAAIAVLLLIRPRWRGFSVFGLMFVCVLTWFYSTKPSANLNWATDVAVMPFATIEGDLIHFHNIRNFDYRSETDYTPKYYDKTCDLTKLRSIDFILSYWSGRAIAHAFVSFGFGDDSYLAVSIETRKEKIESYSAIKGFFRQYELIYVVADERDLIGLRTNHRGEDVYLFRMRTPREKERAVLLDYVKEINSLHEQPQFYNALTANCTTSILRHFRCYPPYPPLSINVLLSGYSARYAYDCGSLDTSMSFDELESRGRVTERAKAAGADPSFSVRIREGIPLPPPLEARPKTL